MVAESQKEADQGVAVETTELSSGGDKYSVGVNDPDNPLELKHLGKKEAWVDCPLCHSRVKTRIKKHAKKEDVAWTSFAYIFSFMYIGGLFGGVHTFTHYCSACDEAIAARRPGSRVAQPVGQSEIKTHESQ